MILEVNKQRTDSELVELFIIDGAYFTSFNEELQFRDYESPYTLRTYTPVPLSMTGVEQKADGAYSRPRLTVANVLETFKDLIGTDANGLVGKRVVRRKTLYKHLGTGSGSTPPTEGPIEIFIIDRKESENAISITFELANPFDLAGITIPSRYIIPNTCAWVYQGAARDATYTQQGGCSWRVTSNNNDFPVYLDSRNNLFITGVSPPTHDQSSAYTKDYIYAIAGNKTRINLNGTTSSVSRPEYFQAIATSSGSLTSSNARRCIPYNTYSAGTTYFAYREGYLFNDYVLYNNRIWRCIQTNVNVAPVSGEFWVRADVCGKKVSSCIARFGSKPTSVQFSNILSTTSDQTKNLPYGGFPSSRRFNT